MSPSSNQSNHGNKDIVRNNKTLDENTLGMSVLASVIESSLRTKEDLNVGKT